MGQVPVAFYARKPITLLCLAAVLLVALTPGAYGGLAFVIPAPFRLAVEILIVISIRRRTEGRDSYSFAFISPVPSRAPPIQ